MTTSTYRLIATRETAALYLAWEFGARRANELMHTLPPVRGSLIDLSNPACNMGLGQWSDRRRAYGVFTERAAMSAAAKVQAMALYQQGRLGKPATALCIVERAA